MEYSHAMSDSASSYPAFRHRLDDVLRQRNPAALRAFLIAEGQWTEETATDPEAAMWMMIATSPALASQRDEARQWLMTHGHEAEAQAIFGARRSPATSHMRGGHPQGMSKSKSKSSSQKTGKRGGKSGSKSGKPAPRHDGDSKRPRHQP